MIYYIGNQEKTFLTQRIQHATIEDLLKYFKNSKVVQLDTETTGFDPHSCSILCIQFGDYFNQFVVDLSYINIQELLPLFKYNVIWLLQNAKFDLRFLLKYNIELDKIYDTFLAELVLNTGTERQDLHVALDDLVWKYCNYKLDKTIRGTINKAGLTDKVIVYAAEDVQYLEHVYNAQKEQISMWKLQEIIDLENEVTKVFAKMEYAGVELNIDKWTSVATETEASAKKIEAEMDGIILTDPIFKKLQPQAFTQNLFGFEERKLELNWGSSQQKQQVLSLLNINENSTGDVILQRNKQKHPIISKLIDYNKQSKLANAFGKSFLEHVNKNTGRVHMDIWPVLSTGRIAVSNPNLNQIPSKGDLAKVIRSAFIPKKGYKIVGGDYSGMELRIIAEFSKDPVWVNAFLENKDLHSELAALTFGIDVSEVKNPFPPKPDLKYRDVQKTVNFGLAYGMSKFKLADTIQVSVEEADKIITKFFDAVPKVKQFLAMLGESGKSKGYIRTGPKMSRVRWFPEWKQTHDLSNPSRFKILGEIERASMNTPIQGLNANVIKLALINVQKEIDTNKWPVNILMAVYDEIQTECEESVSIEWCKKLEEIMIESAKQLIETVPIVVDCGIHDYWQK